MFATRVEPKCSHLPTKKGIILDSALMLWPVTDTVQQYLPLIIFQLMLLLFHFLHMWENTLTCILETCSKMAELTPVITAVLLKFTSVLLMTLIGQVSHQPKTLHMLCYLKGQICGRIYYFIEDVSLSTYTNEKSLHFKAGWRHPSVLPFPCLGC